jgi:PiT family inorganic phosphate transporter
VFAFTNGFHDAGDAIATSVSTHALTPRLALLLATCMNFLGAFLGTQVAATVYSVIAPPSTEHALWVVGAAVGGAILWNVGTWLRGISSSSTHALVGGLVGVGLVTGTDVRWNTVVDKVVLPMVFVPAVGALVAFLAMVGILWVFRNNRPGPANRSFRLAQSISTAAVALGHGLQDAQKTIAVMVLALVTAGYQDDFHVPWWAVLLTAGTIALGTYAGGLPTMRTLRRRIIHVDPPRGFAAETVAAAMLYVSSYVLAAPVSTMQVITGSVAGAGATRGRRSVRWGVAGNIVIAWLLTLPMAAALAALLCAGGRLVLD